MENVKMRSALENPHEDKSMDVVISIGRLHHTGGLEGAIDKLFRVLRPRGVAVVMIYNASSLRRRLFRLLHRLSRVKAEAATRKMEKLYDANQGGDEASCLVYTTPDDLGVLFKDFSEWKCDKRNFDGLPYALRMGFVSRLFLYTIARFAGLDLHITAKK